VHQISSKQDDLSLRYNDFTLFSKWWLSAILNFWNFKYNLCWDVILHLVAKFYWNRTIVWWVMPKTFFTMTAVRHLKFWKKLFLVMRLSSSSLSATDYSVPNLIKIGRFITDNAHFVMNLIVKKIKIGQYFSQCYERTSSGTFYGVLCSIHGICLLNPTKKYQGNKYLVASTSKSNKYSNSSKIALLRTACGRGQSYLALSLAS